MSRVIKTRTEFEGVVTEKLALEGTDLERWPADRELTVVGKPHPRIDGTARVTGHARYVHDLVFPGMLHCLILRSPHARARVLDVDHSAALLVPGVRDVLHAFNAPAIPFRGEPSLFRSEVRFAGDEVAAILADDEDAANEALDRIIVEYEVLPSVVDVEQSLAADAPQVAPDGNVRETSKHDRGDVETAFRSAEHTIEAEYRTAAQMHNSMEPHGAVVLWDGNTLTVHESTQYVFGVRAGVAASLGLPLGQVRVICDYMGGGFGSKNNPGKYTLLAAHFAMRTGRPVRAVLTRVEENLAAGSRSSTYQRIRVGIAGGAITAIEHLAWSNAGQSSGVMAPVGPTNVLYDIPNLRTRGHAVQTNLGSWAAFRAPGYVEGTFALESAIDEAATKAGLDPLALRTRHATNQRDLPSGNEYSLKELLRCYERGAELIGWDRRHVGGLPGSAPSRRRGIGMASQTWSGGGTFPAYVTVHLNTDGTVVVRAGTQDLGTGTKTLMAQIVAEDLGVPFSSITVELGDTTMPYAPLSAGSLTAPSIGPATRAAAVDAYRQLCEIAGGVLEIGASEIRSADGKVSARGASTPLAEILAKLANYTVIGHGSREPNPPDLVVRSFGAQFADVEVDTGTGEVHVRKIVAVHDVGRVVNPMGARSQMEGGILQGLGFTLLEERVVDRHTGRNANSNLEAYKIPTVMDVPEMVIELLGTPDDRANNLGAKGLGEPPIIPTAGAIANAVANAIGVRIRRTPMTADRVLAALQAGR